MNENELKWPRLKYPRWQVPLQETILEFDRETLALKIEEVETLIFERHQEISSDPDHHDERQALADAITILRELKKAKLSYPDCGTQKQF
jgi:hypothetical protein